MIETGLEWLKWAFFLTGSFFVLSGSIGMLRLPDFFSRVHAAGLIDGLGAIGILLAVILHTGFTQEALKAGIIIFFLLISSPAATHAICHAARHHGRKNRH